MSSIRVTYSGLIAFGVSLIGVITGTIFVIMVTRKLTPDELDYVSKLRAGMNKHYGSLSAGKPLA